MSVNRPLNILLVGGESAGVQTLRLLIASHHNLMGVMATPSENLHDASLWNAARKYHIDCIPAEQIRVPEFAAEIDRRNIDVLLNVHALHLIPGIVLDACRIGAFNLHPGPLPEYAGLDVPSWAIYNGETTHGVTLHQMVPKVDAGSIAYQSRFDIRPSDTGLSVMSRCVRHGMLLVKSLLDDLYQDPSVVPRIAQDLTSRRYFYRQAPNHGRLNWNRPAAQVVSHLRAADYSPFPSPWGHPVSRFERHSVGFVKATVTEQTTQAAPGTVGHLTDKGILVASGDFWIDVTLVEVDGRKERAAQILHCGGILSNADPAACARVQTIRSAGNPC
ncbi:MAG: formyltransferase family protein [Planctomycetaceae bacterium]|jgi:methionyl-tRNA formyltransferase